MFPDNFRVKVYEKQDKCFADGSPKFTRKPKLSVIHGSQTFLEIKFKDSQTHRQQVQTERGLNVGKKISKELKFQFCVKYINSGIYVYFQMLS